MKNKSFLFAALVCVLGWCCVSCEPNDPTSKTDGGSGTYVAKVFSVSANKQVVFSPGNLQYQASTDTWRFANHQYDYVGELNSEISPTNENWIDLFGWGTGNNPTNISKEEADYATFVDWGTNKIGKDKANTWRTLTKNEWEYLLFKRISAAALWGIATVNNIHGLILLPDDFTLPEDLNFVAGGDRDLGWALNVYTTYDWEKMEQNGAVFLPAAGNRHGQLDIYSVSDYGDYWTATPYNLDDAYHLFCGSDEAGLHCSYGCHYGHAVRLVQDL